MKRKILVSMLCSLSMALSAGEVRQYKSGEIPSANDIARMLGGAPAEDSRPVLHRRGISLNASAVATQQVQQPAAAPIPATTYSAPVTVTVVEPSQPQQQSPQITSNSFALPIQFKINSATILESALPQLNAVAEGLMLISNPVIVIEGHTDLSGKATYNKTLSERRATSVRNYFVNNYGLSPASFIVVGRGSESLINAQNPYAAENRRVEFRAAR